MDPITLALILTAAGATIGGGVGAIKGGTDGKKGNMLSSTLKGAGIGGLLGGTAGIAGPALGLFGAGAGSAAAAGAGTAAAALPTASTAAATGLSTGGANAIGGALAAQGSAGAGFALPTVSGAGTAAATGKTAAGIGSALKKGYSFMNSPGFKNTMGLFQSIGGSQQAPEVPAYLEGVPMAQNVPFAMDAMNPYLMSSAAPLPQTMSQQRRGYA